MGRTPGRNSIAPLLILLTFSVSAAAQTEPQRAAADVRIAADHGRWLETEAKASDALRRFGLNDDDAIWEIRVRRAEALLSMARSAEAKEALEPELPQRLGHSALAIRRLLLLAFLGDRKLLAEAQKLATAYQPSMVPEVMLVQSVLDPKIAATTLP